MNQINGSQHSIMRIAIIGFGPKGLYGLERLLAELSASKVKATVQIDIYNRTRLFGCGDVYRPDQPAYFKMNIPTGKITMWRSEEPFAIVPHPKSFQQWCEENQCQYAKESDFPPRGLVGKYLNEGYNLILDHLPENIQVIEHVTEVVNLHTGVDGISVITSEAENTVHRYDSVLLATGHPAKCLTPDEKNYLESTSNKPGKGFVPFIYPEQNLHIVQPGSVVGVKGMGLTFVDAVLALTEGRKGQFYYTDGKLKYNTSGDEPAKIYPFSRRGLPMVARSGEMVFEKIIPQFFTRRAVKKLKQVHGQIDFERDLWPLFIEEMKLAVYERLFHQYGYASENPGGVDERSISAFHDRYPEVSPWSLDKWLNPLSKDVKDTHQKMMEYLIQNNEDARKGTPDMNAGLVWSSVLPAFDLAFEDSGLTPDSHKKFDEVYAPILQRISYGPPVENMEKVVALAEAGIVSFSMARCKKEAMDNYSGGFCIESETADDQVEVDYLIDARIPKMSLADARSGLYYHLLRDGEISRWFHKGKGSSYDYAPGCLELTSHGQVINANNEANDRLFVTGTPTEGITFDNDSISPHRNDKFVKRWIESVVKKLSLQILQSHQTPEFSNG